MMFVWCAHAACAVCSCVCVVLMMFMMFVIVVVVAVVVVVYPGRQVLWLRHDRAFPERVRLFWNDEILYSRRE
eukprot:COSAG01_NODE_833_length_13236_cov_1041.341022_18_plen_73_part_00